MSLRVWLPLNRDLRNQGLKGVDVVNNGATLDNYAYSFNGSSQYIQYSGFDATSAEEITVACWVKPTNATLDGVFSISRKNTWQFGIANATRDGIDNCLIVRDNSIRLTGPYKAYPIGEVESGKWIHICCSYNKGIVKIYKNGVLYSTNNVGGTHLNDRQDYGDGGWLNNYWVGKAGVSSDYFSGSVYDFRLYDHALSKKEVAELARGCVLHYPMNDTRLMLSKYPSITWNQLCRELNNTNWKLISDTTGTISNGIASFTVPAAWKGIMTDYYFDFIAGHKYFSSVEIKTNAPDDKIWFFDDGGHFVSIYAKNSPNKFTRYNQIKSYNDENKHWRLYVWDTRTSGFDEVQVRKPMLIDLTLMFGAGNEPTLDEFLMMYPGEYYPYDTGTTIIPEKILKDVSGFDNHSLITGSLPLITTPKSPRYDKCMNIDNSGTNKNYANCTINAPQVKSASFWVYIGSSFPSNSQIIFQDRPDDIAFGFYSNRYCIIHASHINTGSSYYIPSRYDLLNEVKYNNWNHIVINHLGTTTEMWLNGIKLSNPVNEGWGYNYEGFCLGTRVNKSSTSGDFTGQLSDFRLFSRVLTQQDVDDLYKDSLVIDKNQNGYTYELNESDAQSSVDVKKNGQLKCKNYSEQFDGLYLPAGTYVDTLLNYAIGDTCKAETYIKYDTNGSGRDLMGYAPNEECYWGVKDDGTWDWTLSSGEYTNSDITKYNRIRYEYASITYGTGNYIVGALYYSSSVHASVRNKTIYHVKLWKNGVLERDLYPCSIGSQCGLIDGLTGTFYPANNSNASLVSGTVEAKIGKTGFVQANQINEY